MRIASALVSGLLLGAWVGPAHAGDKHAPPAKVAVLTEPARSARAALTGEHALTKATAATAATAAPAPASPRLDAFLDATDITAEIAPHSEALKRCYVDHVAAARRPGHLDVLFEISRDGHVRSVAAAAPGLTPRTAQQVASCIRGVAEAVQFPRRRNHTTAILPYEFHKVEAPNAGPQLSCWNPQGC